MSHPLLPARSLLFAVTALLGACVLPVRAVDYTWDPNADLSNAAGSGAWNTTSAVWNNGSADAVWPNSGGENAVFNGADGAYSVTVASGITANLASFNASGYTLSGASAAAPGSLTLGIGSPTALSVPDGKTLTFGSNLAVKLRGSFNSAAAGNGTLSVVGASMDIGGGNTFFGGALNIGAGGSVTGQLSSFGSNYGTPRPFAITVDGAGASFSVSRSNYYNVTLTINNGAAQVGGGGGGQWPLQHDDPTQRRGDAHRWQRGLRDEFGHQAERRRL